MNIDKMFIGKKIKQFRKKKNLSIAQLAELVGLSDKHLGRIEAGQFVPNSINLINIMNVLEISLEEFGINVNSLENSERNEILKLIYLSSDREISKYLKMLKILKEE